MNAYVPHRKARRPALRALMTTLNLSNSMETCQEECSNQDICIVLKAKLHYVFQFATSSQAGLRPVRELVADLIDSRIA